MAQRKSPKEHPDREDRLSTPIDDEADILAEAHAEPGEDGLPVISEAEARKLGAINVDSVQENRRRREFAKKKREGKPVSLTSTDPLVNYETLIGAFGNSMDVRIKRVAGGAPIQDVIQSRPQSATELHNAIKAFHGSHPEAQYEINFVDSYRKMWRGSGRITLPNTLAPGQTMYYPPNGYPQTPPNGQVQPTQAQPAAQAPPQDMGAMLHQMREMFTFFESMKPSAAGYPQQPSQPPMPPPAGADMMTQMTWMKQMWEFFQQTQPRASQQPTQPQNPEPPPAVIQPPSRPPMPGYIWRWFPDDRAFAQVLEQPAQPAPQTQNAFRRPSYTQEEDRRPPPGPPQRPVSPGSQFREAFSVIRGAFDVVDEFNNLRPGQQHPGFAAPAAPEPMAREEEDDDSPTRTVDWGPYKGVVNREDESPMIIPSLMANSDKIFKWLGETIESATKARAERQKQQPQLQPGQVIVTEGYRPPPGYVAVVEAPAVVTPPPAPQQQLPPPPENIPPPIQQAAPQGWGMPNVPEEGS